jgi:hypothetical protein
MAQISGTECPECGIPTPVVDCPDHLGCPKCSVCGFCDVCADELSGPHYSGAGDTFGLVHSDADPGL